MQANSVLTLLVGVLAIAVSENAHKSSFSPEFPSNWRERLQRVKLTADQTDALQGIATEAIREAVYGVLNIALFNDNDTRNCSLVADERGIIGGNLQSMIDTVRKTLQEGLPSRCIPPLDPFTYGHLPKLSINIPDVLQAELQLDNVTFKGLAEFQEDIPKPSWNIKKWPPTFSVNVVFDVLEPLLQFDTAYSLDAHAPDLDIWGIGNLIFKLYSLRVNGAVSVNALLTGTQVDPCQINVAARSSKVELTGLLGGGTTSELIGEIFTDLVNENMNTLFSAAAQLVETKMCAYFRSKGVLDWLRFVGIIP